MLTYCKQCTMPSYATSFCIIGIQICIYRNMYYFNWQQCIDSAINQPVSTVMKSSLAGVPLKNRLSAVTDAVRFSHAGRLAASTMLVRRSTVALNNTAELLVLTSTTYLKVWFPPDGIPVALSVKVIQKMTAVTGIVSFALMTIVRPSGALGSSGSEEQTFGDCKHI